MKVHSSKYRYRYLSRFIIECETPLALASGEQGVTTDALVARDINGLPYIPGTSIAGVIRHMMGISSTNMSDLWGYQIGDEGRGSEIRFTEGKILNSDNRVIDGLQDMERLESDSLLKHYFALPIRQHVSMTEQGIAASTGKFDEEVVFKGTRFCFELEIVSANDNMNDIEDIINTVRKQSFRLGGGTRKGFGKIRVTSVKTKKLDLSSPDDLNLYLTKSSDLSDATNWWECAKDSESCPIQDNEYITYSLHLQPEDFFMFGSGFGDDSGDADMTSVKEAIINDGKYESGKVLIPATSVKGAIRHRLTFHYNRLCHKNLSNDFVTTKDCPAVQRLFGFNGKELHRGNVMISDIFENKLNDEIIIPHVSIDKFTGGASKGALFAEKPTYGKGMDFKLDVMVKKSVLDESTDENPITEALEATLTDICKGMLPLGGGTNRGNGVFKGSIIKSGNIVIYEN